MARTGHLGAAETGGPGHSGWSTGTGGAPARLLRTYFGLSVGFIA